MGEQILHVDTCGLDDGQPSVTTSTLATQASCTQSLQAGPATAEQYLDPDFKELVRSVISGWHALSARLISQ